MSINILDRSSQAPFDFRAENQKPELISPKLNGSLKIITKENIILRNYCMSISQIQDFNVPNLKDLATTQAHARVTASKYLDNIAPEINKLFDLIKNFCVTAKHIKSSLMDKANRVDTPEGQQEFLKLFKVLQKGVTPIKKVLEELTGLNTAASLPSFRKLASEDVRNFGTLQEDIKSLKKSNDIEISSLTTIVQEQSTELTGLNEKITETNYIVGGGSLCFVISIAAGLMSFGVITIATIGVIGAGLGTAIYKLSELIKKKEACLQLIKQSNDKLFSLSKENTIITNLQEQLKPIEENGKLAVSEAQTVYEQWRSFLTNFENIKENLENSSQSSDPELMQIYLEIALKTIEEIKDTVEKQQKTKYMDVKTSKALLSHFNLPPYFVTANDFITLPSELFLAFAEKRF